MHLNPLLFFLFLPLTSFAQSKTLNLDNFTRIDISVLAEVDITYGRQFEVTLSANEKTLESITAEVTAGELRFARTEGDWWDWFFETHVDGVEIAIVMPDLQALDVSGAASVQISGFSSPSLSIDVAGASNVELNGNYDALTCDLAGASEVELVGGGKTLVLDVAGAADIDAEHYIAESVTIDAAGAVDVEVHATRSLRADVSGAGSVCYHGNPTTLATDVSGSADIDTCD